MKAGPGSSDFAVKICGITNPDDAEFALAQGADYLGFVLYPKSPRGVTPEQAGVILDTLPPGVRAVGVFVNESLETVARVVRRCGLAAAQLHGNEREAEFRGAGVSLWRAVRLEGQGWTPAPEKWQVERFLMDAATPDFGGSGSRTNWSEASKFARLYPAMLAGGLTPENVAEAIRRVRPLGVDVSSGVEAAPGKKDRRKVREFIRRARQAAAELEEGHANDTEEETRD